MKCSQCIYLYPRFNISKPNTLHKCLKSQNIFHNGSCLKGEKEENAVVTDIFVLEYLNLKLGDEITLLELDDRVEKYIDNKDIPTPLQSYDVEEIISWDEYSFYTKEGEMNTKINFEVVKNTNDENTIIRIVK